MHVLYVVFCCTVGDWGGVQKFSFFSLLSVVVSKNRTQKRKAPFLLQLDQKRLPSLAIY